MGEEHFQAALNATPCWEKNISKLRSMLRPAGGRTFPSCAQCYALLGEKLPAPHPLAGKRKSGSRCAAFAGCVSVARQWLLRSVGLHNSLRLEMFFLSGEKML
ncbi:hypothetical protein EDM59_27000 [Brevibacillus nitrificans]|uniref:Uncharacterized protein n=1 Tax=Brevibacillus nitrificans TaxID=651560 RepID=A0A3M8CWY1_9BACL|nr:hypothetical protein EDM59_27000 [Brevibacillus nitrificans]